MRCGAVRVMSAPSKRIVPPRGTDRLQIERIVVVLPMPLRPISATTSPSFIAKSTPKSAWLAP